MHISPRPIQFAFEAPAAERSRGWLRPVLAYAVIVLLTAGSAVVLAHRGVGAPFPCGDEFAAACAAP